MTNAHTVETTEAFQARRQAIREEVAMLQAKRAKSEARSNAARIRRARSGGAHITADFRVVVGL